MAKYYLTQSTSKGALRGARLPYENGSTLEKLVMKAEIRLNVLTLSDWYNVILSDVIQPRVKSFLKKEFGGSQASLLQHVYPDYSWKSWKFENVSVLPELNVASFVIAMERRLGVMQLDDWFNVNVQDIMKYGNGVLAKFNCSLSKMLYTVYPEKDWHPWRFSKVPESYWESTENQMAFIAEFEKNHGVSSLDKWYNVRTTDIQEFGGAGLLRRYNDSFHQMLEEVYPDRTWLPWLFTYTSKNCWTPRTKALFVENIERKHGVYIENDWYDVNQQHLIDEGGWQLLHMYKGGSRLFQLLSEVYPTRHWDHSLFPSSQGYKPQNYWLNDNNVITFLSSLSSRLHISNPQDLGNISSAQLKAFGAGGLIKYWPQVLSRVYPQVKLDQPSGQSQKFLRSNIGIMFT